LNRVRVSEFGAKLKKNDFIVETILFISEKLNSFEISLGPNVAIIASY
jgi:hypothetical protein